MLYMWINLARNAENALSSDIKIVLIFMLAYCGCRCSS